jgi:hypothetical protein
MKVIITLLSLVLLNSVCSCSSQEEYSSFHPEKLWKDNNGVHINAHGGGILFHEGTYFWYGEHKVEGKAGNIAQIGIHVYSSTDLYNWNDEGIALSVVEDNPEHDITKGSIMERPKVIYNEQTGEFVMWFHLELKGQGYGAARAGVAVSKTPTGPFVFVESFRPNAGYWPLNVQAFHKEPVADEVRSAYGGYFGGLPAHPDSLNLLGRDFEKGQMSRDMNLFVDDDGTAYQIYSSEENSTLHISQLTDDYRSYSGKYVRLFSERYMEAPALFKTSNGRYYLVASDCTGWAPNAARSVVANSIWGPWKELGNPCVGGDAELTFHSQSTYVLPIGGKEDAFIFMGDRWNPDNAIDGRYVWLPVQFENEKLKLEWMDQWDLSFFDEQ